MNDMISLLQLSDPTRSCNSLLIPHLYKSLLTGVLVFNWSSFIHAESTFMLHHVFLV